MSGFRRRPRQLADVAQGVDALDCVVQALSSSAAEHRGDEGFELGLESLALLAEVWPRDAGIVARLERRAVVELDRHLGHRVRPAGAEVDAGLLAQALD